MSSLAQFTRQAQRRLNLLHGLQISCWTALAGGLAMLIWAILHRLRGEAVPTAGFVIAFLYAALVGFAWWALRRLNRQEATAQTDQRLGLKDALNSAVEFSAEEGEVYQVQRHQTETQLKERSPSEMRDPLPRLPLGAGVASAALAIGLGFLPASPEVQAREALEIQTEERTEEVRRELEKHVEDILETLSEEEREVLAPHELKQWVDELKATKDQKEALRQLARFEQKLSQALRQLDSKEEDQALKLAAAELSKSELSDARQLGKKLEGKKLDDAAKKLDEVTEKARPSKEQAKTSKLSKKERRKLREMTRRMANAARKQQQAGKQNRKGKGRKSAANPNGKNGRDGLGQMMADLDDAAREIEEADDAIDGELEDGMDDRWAEFDESLERLKGKFRRMKGRQDARNKLRRLRSRMSRMQSYAMGQCHSCNGAAESSPMAQNGGLPPGTGSNESRRDARDNSQDQGRVAELQGQLGEGPSITAVEDAESGTGTSGRTSEARRRNFQRQLESFVHRDDIPEETKLGVKEYFQRIHEVEEKK